MTFLHTPTPTHAYTPATRRCSAKALKPSYTRNARTIRYKTKRNEPVFFCFTHTNDLGTSRPTRNGNCVKHILTNSSGARCAQYGKFQTSCYMVEKNAHRTEPLGHCSSHMHIDTFYVGCDFCFISRKFQKCQRIGAAMWVSSWSARSSIRHQVLRHHGHARYIPQLALPPCR
jgi:hypothetical protein